MLGFSTSKEKESKGAEGSLSSRWTELVGLRGTLDRRCEDYAMWTLPSIFPRTFVKNEELQGALDSIGARAVNNLSNKLVQTLFGQQFFRLEIKDDLVDQIADQAVKGQDQAAKLLQDIDTALAKAEKRGMKKLEKNGHRTQSIMAAKGLIITGNSLVYAPKDGREQTYSLRDYCVVRDLSGTVIEIMTVDRKKLNTFKAEIRDKIKAHKDKKYQDDKCDITLYTRILLKDDGKFYIEQHADSIDLEAEGFWTKDDLPWIPLTWNLIRGEDYGRGLVEDYAGAFHALYVLAQAEVDLVGIAADIKFTVDPTSTVNVEDLNNSPSGSYHAGKKDDVNVIQINKIADMQLVESMVQRLEQQIGAAFLLQSATTRDAERVTATEIESNARELDIANGGIYSRFADEWQYPIAVLMLKGIDIKLGNNKTIDATIITGLDSLSRAGELEQLRLLFQDLAMTKELPDQILAALDMKGLVAYCAVRRGIDYEKFLKSDAQMQKEAQAEKQAEVDKQQQLAATQFAGAAGKAAVSQPQTQE